jgi:hypothetical protein
VQRDTTGWKANIAGHLLPAMPGMFMASTTPGAVINVATLTSKRERIQPCFCNLAASASSVLAVCIVPYKH